MSWASAPACRGSTSVWVSMTAVGGCEQRRAGHAGRVSCELDPRRRLARADRIEVDESGDPVGEAVALDELGGAQAAVRTAVRGDEDDRVRERGAAEVARQLQERSGAGAVVVGALRAADVVAVRKHDEHALRLGVRRAGRRGDRDEVHQLARPESRDLRRERLSLDVEAVAPGAGTRPIRRRRVWPSVPGERSGARLTNSRANWTAVVWSKNGWTRGGGSASGLPTLKAATSTGTATTSQAAR